MIVHPNFCSRIKKQSYSHGKFLINDVLPSCHQTEKWIREKQFLNYEGIQFRFNKKSRKRNRLYCFDYEPADCRVIMKVSQISRHYKLKRKIDLYINNLFKDYNYKGYIGSLSLQQAGVDTVRPIAYWTFRSSWLTRKSYLLYQKVESELTVTELCKHILQSDMANKDALAIAIANRCVDIVQKVHLANVRHDDPHGGNILTDLKRQNISALNVEDIANARFTLIDNDRCTLSRIIFPTVKRFFDLKCLARFKPCGFSQQELLHLYLKDSYRTCWKRVLNFWITGGFNFHKRINFLKLTK